MLKRKKGRNNQSEVNNRCSDVGKEDREKKEANRIRQSGKKNINTKKLLTLIRKPEKQK